LFRSAAAILLVLVGFGTGSIIQRYGNEPAALLSTPLIAQYGHVVDQALEHNLSGTSSEWQAPQGPVIVWRHKYITDRRFGASSGTASRLQKGDDIYLLQW